MSSSICLSPFNFPQRSTPSASPVGQKVDTKAEEAARAVGSTPGTPDVFNELLNVGLANGLMQTREGFQTLVTGVRFLRQLPRTATQVEVSIDPDGEIAFEWYRGDKILSISLSRGGRLSYAADVEDGPGVGTLLFRSEIPQEIMRIFADY